MLHHFSKNQQWREEGVAPFDELILSWNAVRPLDGAFCFYMRVKIDQWSPWLIYAWWGSEGQMSFLHKIEEVSIHQDILTIGRGKKATGFQIEIAAKGDASLSQIRSLHIYTNGDLIKEPQHTSSSLPPISLQVPGLSQMILNHVRHRDLCSPTSTTAVVRYLSQKKQISPLYFSHHVWDRSFDVFGNWTLNVAQAAVELGPAWSCWVERLSGFDAMHARLSQGTPLVISVQGPLKGSAQPYPEGHLLAVTGYDSLHEKVLCMDPAFPSNGQAEAAYDLTELIQAWNRRGRVAYIFTKENGVIA